MPIDSGNLRVGQVRQGYGPVLDITHPRFGAVEGTDCTAAINAAIAAAYAAPGNVVGPFPSVYIPAGLWLISGPIVRSAANHYVNIIGAGQRQTIIRAAGGYTGTMLELLADNAAGTAGRTRIADFTLDGNNTATVGIDARGMRYWTMQGVEVQQIAGTGLRTGNWVVRIINNRFANCVDAVVLEGRTGSLESTNAFQFRLNDITTCDVGLRTTYLVNDLVIEGNSFDTCVDAGIWITQGARHLSICRNYFERCGKTGDGVSVQTAVSTFVDMPAAIVAHGLYTGLGSTLLQKVNIEDNYFGDGNEDRHIALANVAEVTCERNYLLETFPAGCFVDLFWNGANHLYCRRLLIDGDMSSVTRAVAFNASISNAERDAYCNIVLRDRSVTNTGEAVTRRGPWYLCDPSSAGWNTDGRTINTSTYRGSFKLFEFVENSSGTPTNPYTRIDVTPGSEIRGRFIRFHCQAFGGASDAAGIRLRVFLNGSGTASLDINRTRSGSYQEQWRGATMYIPTDATSIRFQLNLAAQAITTTAFALSICDASYDIHEIPSARIAN